MAKIGEFNVPVHSPLTYTGGELLYQSGSLKLDGRSIGTVGQTLKVEGAATTTITDSGATGHVCTLVGTAALSTTQKKLGNGSLYLDGNSDYVTVPDSADWEFGTGDFTIDFWVRFVALPSDGQSLAMVSHCIASGNKIGGWAVLVGNSSGVYSLQLGIKTLDVGGWVYHSETAGFSVDTWYHCAITRASGTSRLFVDGTKIGSDGSMNYTTDTTSTPLFSIGGYSDAAQIPNSYIDEVRVSKGIARWTTDFTAPTTAFVSDANTKLLLHCDLIPKWSA